MSDGEYKQKQPRNSTHDPITENLANPIEKIVLHSECCLHDTITIKWPAR